MTIGSPLLSFVAGVLSIFSPCVLPILPIVLGAAASNHRLGPVALAAGLSISFVAIGMFVATLGYAVGLDAWVFGSISAALIVAMGIVLLLPGLQAQLALASGPIANWADRRFDGMRGDGLLGQFGCRHLVGRGLESVRRTDAWRRLAARLAGPRPGSGCDHHVCIWSWCGPPVVGARNILTRSYATIARSDDSSRPWYESSAGQRVRRDWVVGFFGA